MVSRWRSEWSIMHKEQWTVGKMVASDLEHMKSRFGGRFLVGYPLMVQLVRGRLFLSLFFPIFWSRPMCFPNSHLLPALCCNTFPFFLFLILFAFRHRRYPLCLVPLPFSSSFLIGPVPLPSRSIPPPTFQCLPNNTLTPVSRCFEACLAITTTYRRSGWPERES